MTDRQRLDLVVVGSSATFVAGGGWVAAQPGGLIAGALAVTFFGAVLVVELVAWRSGGRPPLWSIRLGSAAYAISCVVLLIASTAGGPPYPSGQVVLMVVCAVGAVFFGAGAVVARRGRSRRAPRRDLRGVLARLVRPGRGPGSL